MTFDLAIREWLLLALLSTGGCTKVEYFYFDFPSGEVDMSDWQEPEAQFYSGDKVPVKTNIDWNGETLQILNVNDFCVPFLEIRSPYPLSNMIITTGESVSDINDLAGSTCATIFRKPENTFRLHWIYWPKPEPSCIRVGDEISINLVPENGSESLVLNAVLVRSGFYWISDF